MNQMMMLQLTNLWVLKKKMQELYVALLSTLHCFHRTEEMFAVCLCHFIFEIDRLLLQVARFELGILNSIRVNVKT